MSEQQSRGSFELDTKAIHKQWTQTSAAAIEGKTGKQLSSVNLFRTCYHHLSKTFRLPTHISTPSSVDARRWTEHDSTTAELIKHCAHFKWGPETQEEYKETPYGTLRNILHFSLFQQLTSLVITKQQLEDIDVDLPEHIQLLDLSHNRFQHVPTKAAHLKYLRILKLPANRIQEVSSVRSLPIHSLEELHLQENEQMKLVDLSGMDRLQYVNCRHAHPKLQMINCASSVVGREILYDDNVRRIFVDSADEEALQSGPQTMEVASSSWLILQSMEWIDQMAERRFHGSYEMEEKRKRSGKEIQYFMSCFQTAFLLEKVIPAEAKIAISQLQTCCAFRYFFPSFASLASDRLKREKMVQFAAFVRFCETEECFLDWSMLTPDRECYHDLSLFMASKYCLDLQSIFPRPNEMNIQLTGVCDNEALFANILLDNFSNRETVRRHAARNEIRSNQVEAARQRCQFLLSEMREMAKHENLDARQVDAFVLSELSAMQTLNQSQG